MTLRGSCLCGGVQFEIDGPVVALRFCHCTNCKKLSGGVGTASGRVRTEQLRVLEGRELVETYLPDEGASKSFCRACGSNLFGGGWPDSEHSSVRLSAIDDGLDQKPGAHVYVRSVAHWETLPEDGLPRFDAHGS
jgi:hypothetical protein